jgi:hypothetical protein
VLPIMTPVLLHRRHDHRHLHRHRGCDRRLHVGAGAGPRALSHASRGGASIKVSMDTVETTAAVLLIVAAAVDLRLDAHRRPAPPR